MKNVTLILARGGSKGIPNKNVMLINGKPLIAYTIEASLASDVHETWVSTDDAEIKRIALDYGAKVIDRPANLATDTSCSESSLLHFADKCIFDTLIFIQATSPLIRPADINNVIRMSDNYDSVFSAYKEHWLPRWRNVNILGSVISDTVDWDINDRPRRQDMSELYVENGAIYMTSYQCLINSGLRYSGNIGVYEMPYSRSFQIDTYDDVEIVKRMLC